MILRKTISFWDEKSHVSINKPGYLRFLLLDSSNSQIHEFWYDYLK